MGVTNFKTTACPMDCFDSCEVVYANNMCKPSKENKITNGTLCKPFAYMIQEEKLRDKNVLDRLKEASEILKQKNKKILHYKGTGNISAFQNIPKIFFEKIKATIAHGSICESAGIAGIEWGREFNVNPPIEKLLESEVVVVWGRNLTVTSRHIYKLIKDKTFITIDPHATKIAKLSKEFFCLPPKGDYQLIKQLNNALNGNTLDEEMLKKLNTSKEQIQNTLTLLKNKKVSFLMGLGAQKYKEGAQVMHEIEKFASNFDVFKEKNEGMWYLGDAAYHYDNKIALKATNTTPYPSVDFADFDIVFIQGANPVVSAPNTKKVIEGLKKAFVIFLGTTNNDTCKYANIIIPAKTFLEKRDVKLSYGHDEVVFTDICEQTNEAVSEYEFTKYMFDALKLDGLLSEDEYISAFKEPRKEKPKVNFIKHEVEDIPLLDIKKSEYYLITSKYVNTINSQFKYDNNVYIHPSNGYKNDEIINIKSIYGQIKARVKIDENVQKNSLLFYAGHKDVNYLTPDGYSDMGMNAIFQDVKLNII
jgi:anaerobic selenocysteine-containing dehydrogenase